jgi:glycosyltransferase involved in cell wall biosynthesis
LRLLHLVHQYPPHFIGGTELYTRTLARFQVLAGHEVSVVCPIPLEGGDGLYESSVEEGVKVFRIPVGPRSRTQVFLDSFRQGRIKEALRAVLRVARPDVIHIQHLMGLPMSLVDVFREAGLPYIVTLHDYWYVCANAQLLTNTTHEICSGPDRMFVNCAQCAVARTGRSEILFLAPGISPLMHYRNGRLEKVLKYAARIIAPTQFVQHTYTELGVKTERLITVRHGLDLPQMRIAEAREARARRHRNNTLHIGYIGGISAQKGIHVLVEAVSQLPVDRVQLTVYGDLSSFPEYVDQLRHSIKHPGISLAGQVTREQIWLALAAFDIVVLPTLWYETSSLILDEAHVVGVPVVASRIGVMREKIEEGRNGMLFTPGDVNALRELLQGLIDNPNVIETWEIGIPTVRSIEEHVRDIEVVYKGAVDTV